MPSLSFHEQETLIVFNKADEPAVIYTHDRALMELVECRGIAAREEHVYDGRVVAKTYEVSKNLLSVRLKAQRSEAQRAVSRAAGKRLNERPASHKVMGHLSPEGQGAASDPHQASGADNPPVRTSPPDASGHVRATNGSPRRPSQ